MQKQGGRMTRAQGGLGWGGAGYGQRGKTNNCPLGLEPPKPLGRQLPRLCTSSTRNGYAKKRQRVIMFMVLMKMVAMTMTMMLTMIRMMDTVESIVKTVRMAMIFIMMMLLVAVLIANNVTPNNKFDKTRGNLSANSWMP